jgi:predicted P-loop ATPase
MSDTYDIRQHISVLTPSKASKTKYHCPVCDGDDLDISKKGAYACFSGGCNPRDIRAAIDKLEGKPDWKAGVDNWVKPVRRQSRMEYFYPDRDGNPLVKVVRIDPGDGTKKKISQHHWDGSKWVGGNPDEVKKQIPIYRYAQVRSAIERGEPVFFVEGEGVVDALWELGIPATTTIGGAGKFGAYGDYKKDLSGGLFVLAPDRDAIGVKHTNEVAQFLGDRVKGYYLAGSEKLWRNPSGAMDISDDIQDYSYSKEQLIERIISTDKFLELTRSPKSPSTQTNTDSADSESAAKYTQLAEGLGIPIKLDSDGKPKSRLANLTLHLFDLVGDRLKLNLMTGQYEFEGKPIDLNQVKSFVAFNLGADYSTENCLQALHTIGSKFAYHPVRQYLENLRGKVEPDFRLLENLATVFLNNGTELANKFLAKTLISAVARVLNPGTKVDTLTVLQGGQGFLKSTFLKTLAGGTWFCDDIRDLENKDELAKLASYWIVELAEVDYLMGRKEVESFKRFLSTTADTYRPPYGRANIRHERTCALFATTNKSEFLNDPTGDRRYWVVEVNREIDCDSVAKHRDIIWATALAAYERGDTWWLNNEEEQARASSHTQYRESDSWGDVITEKCKGGLPTHTCEGGEWMTTNKIFDLLDIPVRDRSRANSNRVTKILRDWGFESTTKRIDGRVRKIWFRSTDTVVSYNLINIELQGYRVTDSRENQSEQQSGLLPSPLPNNPDNDPLGYSADESPVVDTQPNPLPSNGFDPEFNPVNPSPSVSQPLGKEKNCRFKTGDRVRYVGGMIKHQGKSGTIVKVCVDPYVCDYSYVCDFGDKLTEQLPVSELEVA